jgi:GntR family transcriptional regulator, transcriptional repressor for pyruvate dehydrogenase complex
MTQTVADPERVDLIVAAIRDIIARGDPVPPERILAERLNVKRHRLRSALEVLRNEGEIGPSRLGRRPIAPPPPDGNDIARCTNPIEVIEMRLVIEPGLARLAALRASPLEISRIEAAATTPSSADYGAADLAFHMAVAAGARNSLGIELYSLLRRIGTDARVRLGAGDAVCATRIQQRDAEHRAIAAAIAARDLEGAEQATRAHLIAVQRRIIERLTPGLTAA